jgi:perosamine synthetase
MHVPYGRQTIDEADEGAVLEVLRSSYLTTGPMVETFERELSVFTGASESVVVNSGTAALHAAMYALGVGVGDEVIVPALTFAASANSVLYCGGDVVFADVNPATLTVTAQDVAHLITPRTKAIVTVDYGGQPCDYDGLTSLAQEHGVSLVADACHALGAAYRGRPVGTLAAFSCFSFHPVKPITTAEGGAITTSNPSLAARMRTFRNHGITTTPLQREHSGATGYEMVELGYNYRLSDLQCALGVAQTKRLARWIQQRQAVAAVYDAAFAESDLLRPLGKQANSTHAYHLYVVRVANGHRDEMFRHLRANGIGATVHYPPVHLHPFYRKNSGTGPGLCPVVETAANEILSLPIFPTITATELEYVIATCRSFSPSMSSR